MAYTATVTGPVEYMVGGRKHLRWTISETEAASTSEFTITGAPRVGTVVLYQATLTAGTGTTITPKLGKAATFSSSTQNHIATNTTSAAHINDSTNLRYTGLTLDKIFVRSTPNSVTADHSISTIIEMIEGVL